MSMQIEFSRLKNTIYLQKKNNTEIMVRSNNV